MAIDFETYDKFLTTPQSRKSLDATLVPYDSSTPTGFSSAPIPPDEVQYIALNNKEDAPKLAFRKDVSDEKIKEFLKTGEAQQLANDMGYLYTYGLNARKFDDPDDLDDAPLHKGLKASYASIKQLGQGALGTVYDILGAEGLEAASNKAIQQYQLDGAAKQFYKNSEGKIVPFETSMEKVFESEEKFGNFVDWLAFNIGNGAGTAIPMFAAAAINPALAVGMAYGIGVGDSRLKQLEATGFQNVHAGMSLAMGVPYAAVEYAFGGGSILGRIVKDKIKKKTLVDPSRSYMKNIGKEFLGTSLKEGFAEGTQEVITSTAGAIEEGLLPGESVKDSLAKLYNSKDFYKQIAESTAAGIAGGGPFGIAGGIVKTVSFKRKDKADKDFAKALEGTIDNSTLVIDDKDIDLAGLAMNTRYTVAGDYTALDANQEIIKNAKGKEITPEYVLKGTAKVNGVDSFILQSTLRNTFNPVISIAKTEAAILNPSQEPETGDGSPPEEEEEESIEMMNTNSFNAKKKELKKRGWIVDSFKPQNKTKEAEAIRREDVADVLSDDLNFISMKEREQLAQLGYGALPVGPQPADVNIGDGSFGESEIASMERDVVVPKGATQTNGRLRLDNILKNNIPYTPKVLTSKYVSEVKKTPPLSDEELTAQGITTGYMDSYTDEEVAQETNLNNQAIANTTDPVTQEILREDNRRLDSVSELKSSYPVVRYNKLKKLIQGDLDNVGGQDIIYKASNIPSRINKLQESLEKVDRTPGLTVEDIAERKFNLSLQLEFYKNKKRLLQELLISLGQDSLTDTDITNLSLKDPIFRKIVVAVKGKETKVYKTETTLLYSKEIDKASEESFEELLKKTLALPSVQNKKRKLERDTTFLPGLPPLPVRGKVNLSANFIGDLAKIKEVFRQELNRLGLEKTDLEIVTKFFLNDSNPVGLFKSSTEIVNQAIKVAAIPMGFNDRSTGIPGDTLQINPADPRTWTLHHEAFHAFYTNNFFTPNERKILDGFAKKFWRKEFHTDQHYGPEYAASRGFVLEDTRNEEATANKFAAYMAGQYKPNGLVEKLFNRLKVFLNALGLSFIKLEYTSPYQIFDAIQYGQIQKRKAAEDALNLKETIATNIPKFTKMSEKEFEKFFDGSVVKGTPYENTQSGLGTVSENIQYNDIFRVDYARFVRKLYADKVGLKSYAPKFWDSLGKLGLLVTGGLDSKGLSSAADIAKANVLLNSLIFDLSNVRRYNSLVETTQQAEKQYGVTSAINSSGSINDLINGMVAEENMIASNTLNEMSVSPRLYLQNLIDIITKVASNSIVDSDNNYTKLSQKGLLEALSKMQLNLPTESAIAESNTPLVVSHTSNKIEQDFISTGLPFIFSSREASQQRFINYINSLTDKQVTETSTTPHTLNLILSIKNPIRLDSRGGAGTITSDLDAFNLANEMIRLNIITRADFKNLIAKNGMMNPALVKDLTIIADKKGYDGYIVKDAYTYQSTDAYIPFRKNQILKVSKEATDFGNPNMEAVYNYAIDPSDKPVDHPVLPKREELRKDTREMNNDIKRQTNAEKGGTTSPKILGTFSRVFSHARAWAKKYPLFTPVYELVSGRDRKTSSILTQFTDILSETYIPLMKNAEASSTLNKAFEISQQGLDEEYTDPKTGEIKIRKRPGGRYRKNEKGEIVFVAQEDGRGRGSEVKKGDVIVLRGDIAKAYEDVQKAIGLQHQEIIKGMLASENNTDILNTGITILKTYRQDLANDPVFAKIFAMQVPPSQDPGSVNPYENLTVSEIEAIRKELSNPGTFLQPDGNIREEIMGPVNSILGGKNANLNAIIKDMKQYEVFKQNDYIPLQRYGKYFITVKNKDTGELVEYRQFDKGKFTDKFLNDEPGVRQELREKYSSDIYNISATNEVSIDSLRKDLGLEFNAIEIAAGSLSEINQNKYVEVRRELEKVLKEKYGVNKTPGYNMFLSPRREVGGVPGYETDFGRSIAQYGQTSSEFASRARYNASINTAFNKTQNKDINPDDNLRKAAKDWLEYVEDPKQEWARTRRIGFWWFLGGNLSSALLQLMSNVQFVGPILSQFAGTPATIKALAQATKEVSAMLSTSNNKYQDQFIDFSKLPEDVREDALKDIASGLLKQGSAMREAGMNTGSTVNVTRSKFRNNLRTVENTIIGGAFNTMETAARLVAYIATHRLAQNPDFRKSADQFLSTDQQYAFNKNNNEGIVTPRILAQHMVEEGFGIYGKLNRPQIMRGFGSTVFLFQTYISQMYSLMYRMMTSGGRNNKLVGQKIFAKMLLMLLITGGAFGLPGADDANWLVSTLAKLFPGVDYDMRIQFRNMLNELGLPERATEAFENGVFNAYANVDVQRRLSLGTIPGSGQIRAIAGALGISSGARIEEFLGAPGAIVFQNARSLLDEIRTTGGVSFMGAASALTPTFIKNVLKAGNYATNGGRAYSKQGTLITEDIGAMDIVMQGLGFSPTEVSKNRELLRIEKFNGGATQTLRSRFNTRIKEAYRQSLVANQDNDVSLMEESQQELRQIMKDLYMFNSQQEFTYQFQPDLYRLLQEAIKDIYRNVRLSEMDIKNLVRNSYDAQALGVKY